MKKTLREVLVAYNKAAALYDLMNLVYFLGRDKQFRSLLTERLNIKPSDAVLDLCCGTGLDFPFLVRKVRTQGTSVGVDLSSEMLQQAKKRNGSKRLSLVRSEVVHLPFRDETFDAVLVSFCLKITPAYEKSIEEAVRLLKPPERIGVLADHKPSGHFGFPGIILTEILSAMAKIDFEVNLMDHLSKRFLITEDRKMHGSLVQLLVGERINCYFSPLMENI